MLRGVTPIQLATIDTKDIAENKTFKIPLQIDKDVAKITLGLR